MFKLIVYCLLGACLSCSSTSVWDPQTLDPAMQALENQKEIHYGPQVERKENQQSSFIDKTEEYGLKGESASNLMAVDLNNDSYSDLVLIRDYFSQPEFFLFDVHKKKFIKTESLFDKAVKSSYILFYDHNNDGVVDALSGVLNQKSEMTERPLTFFEGYFQGGVVRFKESSKTIGLEPGPAATVTLVDYDLDGDLDLFVGNWFFRHQGSSLPAKDFLLEDQGDKFVDRSELLISENEMNPDETMHVNAVPTFAAQACDMDLNGFPDILAAASNGFLNKLWMNIYQVRGKSRLFKDYGVESLFAGDPEGNLNSRGGGRTFSAACADYNNDGVMDVFLGELSHNYDADSTDRSSVLTGSTRKFPPKFMRTEYVLDAHDLQWNQSDRRGVWLDYNNDGLLDLLVDNSGYPPHTRMLLFKQFPDHSFENVAEQAGVDFVNPLSSIVLDVNRDGKMDILTARSDLRDSRIKKRLYLFVNQHQNENRSIRFYLRGKKSNAAGINATVELKIQKNDDKASRRVQQTAFSYGGLPPQNEEGLLFGVEKGARLESVKVIWPYSKTLNASRAGLEKFYSLKGLDFKNHLEVTLCEEGNFLIGRRRCS